MGYYMFYLSNSGDRQETFFGYVKGDFDEFGTFSLSELESVRGPMGLTIERDIHFKPNIVKSV
jgi:hypothetical protein